MSDGRVKLRPVPCTVTKAKEIVYGWHRHHGSSIGRPVARLLDDGFTLEVTRVATDGTPNACSALYGIARRVGAALGYARMVTYTRADEPGASLRAAGMTDEGPIRARSWNMPVRPRTDKTEIIQRRRWSLELGTAPDGGDLARAAPAASGNPLRRSALLSEGRLRTA